MSRPTAEPSTGALVPAQRRGRRPREVELIPLAPPLTARPTSIISPSGEPLEKPLSIHAAEFLRFCADVLRHSPHTVRSYQDALSIFIAHCRRSGVARVGEVTKPVIHAFLQALTDAGDGPSTIAHRLSVLRSFWDYLTNDAEVTTDNVPRRVRAPKVPRHNPTWHPIPEINAVLTELALDTTPMGRRDYALIATAVMAGLRVEELSQLRVSDVSLDGGFVNVRHGKGDKDRSVMLVPQLVDVLRAYLAEIRPALVSHAPDMPWCFVNAHPTGAHRKSRSGQALTTRSLYQIVRRRFRLLGKDSHPHALRHSFASALIWNGAPVELIRQALGHADLKTTQRYAHLPSARAHEQMRQFLSGLGTGEGASG